jgi:WD40 repeat protein
VTVTSLWPGGGSDGDITCWEGGGGTSGRGTGGGRRAQIVVAIQSSTGKKLQTHQGHTDGVKSVALSADGKHLVTGSLNETAILSTDR